MVDFAKQILVIGSGDNSIETTEGFSIRGDFDMDDLYGKLSFNLPYLLPEQKNLTTSSIDLTRLRKYDTVKLYFDFLKENKENIQPEDLQQVFDGYINNIKLSKEKSSFNYEIEAFGKLGLSLERNTLYEKKEGVLSTMIPTLLQIAALQIGSANLSPLVVDLIPQNKVRLIDTDPNHPVVTIEGGKNLKDVLSKIREKYGVIIHESGDGFVNIMTPFTLLNANNSDVLNVNAWTFRLEENIFSLDYGDLTNHINAVVMLGYPGVHGVAIDPIAVQLRSADGTSLAQDINYLVLENRNLSGEEDCQRAAREKLLEIERNNYITFKTMFNPKFMVGQPLRIIDNDRFNEDQLFILKAYSFMIDKQDVSCDITAYSHSLTNLPQDIVLSDTGINDVDSLEIRNKVDDAIGIKWNSFDQLRIQP